MACAGVAREGADSGRPDAQHAAGQRQAVVAQHADHELRGGETLGAGAGKNTDPLERKDKKNPIASFASRFVFSSRKIRIEWKRLGSVKGSWSSVQLEK